MAFPFNVESIINSLKAVNPLYLIFGTIIILLSLIFSTISNYFIKKRIYFASQFGKLEHKTGRLLGLLIIITFIVELLNLRYTLYFIIACFVCWLIYLVSHTLEKLTYGNHGFR